MEVTVKLQRASPDTGCFDPGSDVSDDHTIVPTDEAGAIKPIVVAPSDEVAVSLLRSGDAAAYSELFRRHSVVIYRYAWGLADRRSDVDDLVQETFLIAWRRRQDIHLVSTSALPWLLTTCRNVAMNRNRVRRKAREQELSDVLLDNPSLYRLSQADAAREQLVWIREEIEGLPEPDKQLCQMCLLEGRSYEEAAQILGLSSANTRKKIQRSRERLRSALSIND